ncbi:MAG: hypothetical protein ACLPLP_23855 [Mycobacterium sp.]
MRTAIGATAVNIAKPMNLSAPMIHAFLNNIRYITIELNGLILYDTRDDVPCDMDKWRETRARFPARWPVVRLHPAHHRLSAVMPSVEGHIGTVIVIHARR